MREVGQREVGVQRSVDTMRCLLGHVYAWVDPAAGRRVCAGCCEREGLPHRMCWPGPLRADHTPVGDTGLGDAPASSGGNGRHRAPPERVRRGPASACGAAPCMGIMNGGRSRGKGADAGRRG